MSASRILLAVIAMQQIFFGLLWLGLSLVPMYRSVARHWGAAALLLALGIGLILTRPDTSPWANVFGGNVALLIAFTLKQRGVRIFAGRSPHDLYSAAAVLPAVGVIALGTASSGNFTAVIVGVALPMCWCLLNMAWAIKAGLTQEFQQRYALFCAVPLVVFAAVWALRAGVAVAMPDRLMQAASEGKAYNTSLVMAAVLFGLVVNAILLALVVIRLVRRLQHASDHDMLTALLNRRGMATRMEAESHRRKRGGPNYSLLSLDIDHFKLINDRYGHDTGDAVLASVAETLSRTVRLSDSVARMGGEEFSILLPVTDATGAGELAHRLKELVAAGTHGQAGLRVTVSVGVASPEPGEALDSLMRRVDAALYAAKAGGRNCVRFAEPVQAPVSPPGEVLPTASPGAPAPQAIPAR